MFCNKTWLLPKTPYQRRQFKTACGVSSPSLFLLKSTANILAAWWCSLAVVKTSQGDQVQRYNQEDRLQRSARVMRKDSSDVDGGQTSLSLKSPSHSSRRASMGLAGRPRTKGSPKHRARCSTPRTHSPTLPQCSMLARAGRRRPTRSRVCARSWHGASAP